MVAEEVVHALSSTTATDSSKPSVADSPCRVGKTPRAPPSDDTVRRTGGYLHTGRTAGRL